MELHVSDKDFEYLHQKGIHRETPYNRVYIDKGNYIVKTADSIKELAQTFKLRYTVYGEFYFKEPERLLDVDDFDPLADHIIVINKSLNQVMGTYRILCSDHVDSFYTEREFNIDQYKKQSGKIAEMGRATVDTQARTGAVITLLWRGVADYIKAVQAEHLIGCATFWSDNEKVPLDAWHYFKSIDVLLDHGVTPSEENRIEDWKKLCDNSSRTDEQLREIKKSLPPLVKSYIKAGALFGSVPARDNKLSSFDFFASCKLSDLSQNFAKKYF